MTSRFKGRKCVCVGGGGGVPNKGRYRCVAIKKFRPAKFLQLKSLMPGKSAHKPNDWADFHEL